MDPLSLVIMGGGALAGYLGQNRQAKQAAAMARQQKNWMNQMRSEAARWAPGNSLAAMANQNILSGNFSAVPAYNNMVKLGQIGKSNSLAELHKMYGSRGLNMSGAMMEQAGNIEEQALDSAANNIAGMYGQAMQQAPAAYSSWMDRLSGAQNQQLQLQGMANDARNQATQSLGGFLGSLGTQMWGEQQQKQAFANHQGLLQQQFAQQKDLMKEQYSLMDKSFENKINQLMNNNGLGFMYRHMPWYFMGGM